MRYITIIMVIVVFWFLQGLGLTLLLQDPLLTSAAAQGNSSYNILDTTHVNMNITDDFSEETKLRDFPSALSVMFTFRTPKLEGMPSIIGVIISFMNWFLVIILGVSIYRVLNPLA